MTDEQKYRYEKKYLISGLSSRNIINYINLNPVKLNEIYSKRIINNIYFDTLNMDSYLSNVEGVSQRIKYRVRWYGSERKIITNPSLELKIKNNDISFKKIYKINDLLLESLISSNFNFTNFSTDIPKNVLFILKNLKPTSFNSYLRKYFLSKDKKIRITIDENLIFKRPKKNTILSSYQKNFAPYKILEVKFDKKNFEDAKSFLNNFPFKITKSSKYVQGICNNLF